MSEIPIKEYVHQVLKRRKIVLLFAASVLAVSALITLQQTRVYRAVSIVEIGAETPDVAFFQEVVNMSPYGWWSALKYYETQYQIIRSRSLLEKAAKRALDKGIVKGMSLENLTAHLQSGVSVGSDDKSRLASIYFDDSNPESAIALVNLISETYADDNLAQKLAGITQAVNWLNDRLTETRTEKKKQEEELQRYKEEHKVVSLGEKENSVAQMNLIALTESLNRLKNKRIEIEAQYQKLSELVKKSENVDDLLGVVNSDLLTKLTHQLSELQTEKSKLSQRYMEKHPAMVQVSAQITQVEKSIRQEVTNEVHRLKTKFLLAKSEEDSVGHALEKQKLETLRIEQISRKMGDIQVITDTNQKIFETLQKKIKEADLSALVRSNNIRIVDRALAAEKIRPLIMTNLLLALLVGLIGGVSLALLLEYWDDTLKTHEDIERYLKSPVLGIIPRYADTKNGNGHGKKIEFVPFEEPSSTAAEFYRTLRTNLTFLSAARGIKKILIASTGPGEGKTATSINLAITMAQSGQKTILVDLDLRRPKLHTVLQVSRRQGVTNVLVKELPLNQAIGHSVIPNLDYLVAGSLPPNPAELLSSNELKEILEELCKRYDRVIIDSSPIAPVTDAVVVSQIVDGVVIVVRAGKTHRKAVMFSQEQLKKVKAEILGVVLNDVDLERSTYSNYQYYKYGYYSYTADQKESAEPELPTASAN